MNNATLLKTRNDLDAELTDAVRSRMPGYVIQEIAAKLMIIRAECARRGLPAW